jgi:desampylase
MALRISSKLHRELLEQAAASPAEEVCGLLVGEIDIDAIVPAANVAVDPSTAFEIDPAVLFAAIRSEREGQGRLLGHYHSHPSGLPMPSPRDAALTEPDGKIWIVIGQGQMRAWRMDHSRSFNEIMITITN